MLKMRFIVSGRVQGVGFRWGTMALAKEIGINGRVWNNDDGTVEILAQSDSASKLIIFEQKLRKGPTQFARVDYLDKTTANFDDFNDFQMAN